MRDLLATRWSELAAKLVLLAEEYPADRYDQAAASGIRSFGDQLRHVAFWNDYAAATLRGEAFDGTANELPRGEYPGRVEVVAALRRGLDAVHREIARAPAIDEASLDTIVGFMAHNAEHYGQLVVYYRLGGLVPPASR